MLYLVVVYGVLKCFVYELGLVEDLIYNLKEKFGLKDDIDIDVLIEGQFILISLWWVLSLVIWLDGEMILIEYDIIFDLFIGGVNLVNYWNCKVVN